MLVSLLIVCLVKEMLFVIPLQLRFATELQPRQKSTWQFRENVCKSFKS